LTPASARRFENVRALCSSSKGAPKMQRELGNSALFILTMQTDRICTATFAP
jgi:hypothetical protein